ncbi:MAG TPA: ABC transporter permease [Chthoniobacterales bacterium]|jgi:putative ABC transport system permease protein
MIPNDLRYAFRILFKTPGFSLVAILTLALGIAASTAIFSVIDGVLLHPLPYPKSEEILTVTQTTRSTGISQEASSPANYLDWRAQNDVFSEMAAASGAQADITGGDQPERIRVTHTTANFFRLFQVHPLLGRTLLPSDDTLAGDHVVVLGAQLWARRYGSEKAIIGRELMLDGEPRTIVGVMPSNFSPDDYGEVWVPSPFGVPPNSLRLHQDPRLIRDSTYLDVWARLKHGVSLERAATQLNAISLRLQKQYPDSDNDTGIRLTPLHEDAIGSLRPVLLLLAAAVGALLLIGCVNVANLLLTRATLRSREISIRAALGASRARIVRQLLTESVVLAVLGGSLGVMLAGWAIPLLLSIGPPHLTAFKGIGLNGEVLVFSLAISVLTGILFGLAPALSASSATPAVALNQGERGTASSGHSRAILIALEVALSLVLLIGAGLLVRSFANLAAVDPGFRSDHLLIFNLGAPARWPAERQAAFYEQTLARLREMPGAKNVGAVSRLPLSGGNSARSFRIGGGKSDYDADIRIATPDYFKTLGIPLLRGRNFDAHDVKDAPLVAIINEAAARAFFPGEDPLGKVITNFGPNSISMQIVGVVGNVRHFALDRQPRPEIYQPLGQGMWPSVFVGIRTELEDPLVLLSNARKAVSSVDRNVPLGQPRTMQDFIDRSLQQRRFTVVLLAIFAGVALVLATVGLYGVISYSVAQRTRELGIRLALGAQRRDVLRLVVQEGMRFVALGIGAGLAGAFALTRLMKSLLYGVGTADPPTFAALTVVLGSVALIACLIPAFRATQVNPIEALRHE